VWNAIQYVGSGLSLIAFVAAAVVFGYRARLKQRAEIIKSAPEKERLEAIAAIAEFFRVDLSGLYPEASASTGGKNSEYCNKQDHLTGGFPAALSLSFRATLRRLASAGFT
jgi:hypothetical protein